MKFYYNYYESKKQAEKGKEWLDSNMSDLSSTLTPRYLKALKQWVIVFSIDNSECYCSELIELKLITRHYCKFLPKTIK